MGWLVGVEDVTEGHLRVNATSLGMHTTREARNNCVFDGLGREFCRREMWQSAR